MGLINDMKNGKIAPANPVRSVAIPTPNSKPKNASLPTLNPLAVSKTKNNDILIKNAYENSQIKPSIQVSATGTGFGYDPEPNSDPSEPSKGEMLILKQYKEQAKQAEKTLNGIDSKTNPKEFTDAFMKSATANKEYEDYKLSLNIPTTGERIKNFFTGNVKDYGGSILNTAATIPTAALGQEESQRISEIGKENVINKWEEALKNPDLNPITRWIYEQRLNNAKRIVTPKEELATADNLIQGGTKDLAVTKRGLSDTAKTAVDVGSAGVQLAGDAAIAAVTGGSALVPMGVRSFGSGAAQARYAGGSTGDQLLYGGLNAGTSVLTEKLFNVGKVFNKVYGKGVADDAIQSAMNSAINKYIASDVGKAVASRIGTGITSGAGEGFEEMLQSSLDPLYQKLTYNPEAKFDAEQVLYDGLVGSSLAFLLGVGGGNVNTNNNPHTNTGKNANIIPSSQPVESPTVQRMKRLIANTQDVQNANTAKPSASDSNIQANESTGAAPKGFSTGSDALSETYQNAIDTYGAMPERSNLARQMEVPQSVSEGTVIPQTVQTIMGSEITPSDFAGQITDKVAQGQYSRAVYDDATAVANAESVIRDKGYQQALADWTADVKGGKVSKYITAMGITLYNNAVNSGDYQTASSVVADMVDNARNAGQALQATNLFNKLTPQGQLYALQRSVQNLSDELTTKYAKKGFKDIKIDDALVKEFLEAPTEEARNAALEKIKDNVALQVPSNWYDKWNAWRYLAMLGNPRTHIRNIVGNAGFAPVRGVKNVIANGIEKLSGIDNKTKAILTKADRPLIEEARKFYSIDEKNIMSLGKFDNFTGDINERRRIYKNPLLEYARKGNTNLLNKEDTLFTRPSYTNALAGWFKANGIKADDISSGKVSEETLNKAREYAIRESQRATYRDSNAFSDWVSRMGNYKGDNNFAKAGNVLIEGVLPFKRTPANILARSVEYSPVGLIKSLTFDLAQVKAGKMEAWQAIDNISAGLTGTGLMGLGVLLAHMGIISGGSSDDKKEKALDTLTGSQPYSLNIGDTSITLDWLAPEALPFFVGVETYNTMTDNSEDGIGLAKALNNLSNIAEPMLNMSMLQGVEDLLSSIKYSDGNTAPSIVATSAVNYFSQGLPTIFGQAERTFESKRETTYIDDTSGVPTAVQYMLGKLGNKIPGIEFQQRPYTDAFGREQSNGNPLIRALNNFANPAYVSELKNDEVTDELYRLNDGNYLQSAPDMPANSFDYGGKTYNLSAEEYTEFSKDSGKLTHDLMQTMIDSNAYEQMTDEQKSEALSNVMSYANDMAKAQYIESKGKNYTPPDIYKGAHKADESGISPVDFYLYKTALGEIDKDGGNSTQLEITKAIEETTLNNKNKGLLWQLQNEKTDPEKNPYTGALARKGLSPEKAIEIMEGYSTIEKAMDNYVKQDGGASTAHVQAAYFKQWLAKQGYNASQTEAITDVFKVWQMIPVDKPSKKAVAFVTANPIP